MSPSNSSFLCYFVKQKIVEKIWNHEYTFTNTGTETVEIAIVSGCDCTTLEWTRGEIKPGEKGVIDVIFDSTEKEASETVDVDMYLKNINPISDSQFLLVLDYTFELVR